MFCTSTLTSKTEINSWICEVRCMNGPVPCAASALHQTRRTQLFEILTPSRRSQLDHFQRSTGHQSTATKVRQAMGRRAQFGRPRTRRLYRCDAYCLIFNARAVHPVEIGDESAKGKIGTRTACQERARPFLAFHQRLSHTIESSLSGSVWSNALINKINF
jgi:hypothetical protein